MNGDVVPKGKGPPENHDALRLSWLFECHYDAVFAYAGRRIGPDRASDIAADVFAVAWRRIGDIPAEHEKPWLISTARNLIRQDKKQQFRRQEMETRHQALERPLAEPADPASHIVEQHRVAQALAKLSEADRELVTLVAWDGMSLAEAAQILDCKPGTARVRWMRARNRLVEILGVEDALADDASAPAAAVAPLGVVR